MAGYWYEGYAYYYRGSEEEHAAFVEWMKFTYPRKRVPRKTFKVYDELIEEYRETQSWEDGYLDFAWPLAVADGRVPDGEPRPMPPTITL